MSSLLALHSALTMTRELEPGCFSTFSSLWATFPAWALLGNALCSPTERVWWCTSQKHHYQGQQWEMLPTPFQYSSWIWFWFYILNSYTYTYIYNFLRRKICFFHNFPPNVLWPETLHFACVLSKNLERSHASLLLPGGVHGHDFLWEAEAIICCCSVYKACHHHQFSYSSAGMQGPSDAFTKEDRMISLHHSSPTCTLLPISPIGKVFKYVYMYLSTSHNNSSSIKTRLSFLQTLILWQANPLWGDFTTSTPRLNL